MLDEKMLAEIKARAEKATPGPWTDGTVNARMERLRDGNIFVGINVKTTSEVAMLYDADFIAHAREDVPALIAAYEELYKRIKENDGACPRCGRTCQNCMGEP